MSVTAVLGKGKGKLPAAGDGGPPVSPERGGCSPATEGDERVTGCRVRVQ